MAAEVQEAVGPAKVPRTFRLPVDLDERLTSRAGELGEGKKTELVVEFIRQGLELRDPEEWTPFDGTPEPAASDSSTSGEAPKPEVVDLAVWLSERTGRPRSICRMRLSQGAVSLDGERWLELSAPADRLGSVTFDGESVH